MLSSTLLRAKTLVAIPKTVTISNVIHHPLFFCTESHSSTIHDLTSTHGFPFEEAKTLASLIHPNPPKKYTAVLALFRDYGFGPSDITSILVRQPSLLNARANTMLKPKLDALARHGIKETNLVQVVTSDPYILRLTLSIRLLPCLQCLSRFFGQPQPLVDLFLVRRGTLVLHKFTNNMEGNIDALRESGVPDDNIVRMMITRPRTLCRDPGDLSKIVTEIKALGMKVQTAAFIHGVITRAGMKTDKWVSKVEVFKKFGWTEREVMQLFVKQPKVMDPSGEKIEKVLKYFLNHSGWTREDVTNYPSLLYASLENKIMPRMSVLKVLFDEGLITKKGIQQALLLTIEDFIAKYVIKYKDQSKHLLKAL